MGYKTSSSSQSSLQIKILKRKHQNYAIDLLKPTLRKFEIFEANGLEGIKKTIFTNHVLYMKMIFVLLLGNSH